MSSEPQKNNAVLIVIAIIGVIGTIVASTIGAVATYNVEKLRQASELTRIALVPAIATQDNSIAPVSTPYPTYTPFPTSPPLSQPNEPVATPIPENPTLPPVIIPSTSRPNLNLSMGESYYGDGVRIALEEIHGELTFHLVVYNERTTPLIFSTYDTYAHLRDDVGNEYQLAAWNLVTGAIQYNIQPSSHNGVGSWGDLVFEGPISPNATYLIFEFEKLLGLENLSWKIPIG